MANGFFASFQAGRGVRRLPPLRRALWDQQCGSGRKCNKEEQQAASQPAEPRQKTTYCQLLGKAVSGMSQGVQPAGQCVSLCGRERASSDVESVQERERQETWVRGEQMSLSQMAGEQSRQWISIPSGLGAWLRAALRMSTSRDCSMVKHSQQPLRRCCVFANNARIRRDRRLIRHRDAARDCQT